MQKYCVKQISFNFAMTINFLLRYLFYLSATNFQGLFDLSFHKLNIASILNSYLLEW